MESGRSGQRKIGSGKDGHGPFGLVAVFYAEAQPATYTVCKSRERGGGGWCECFDEDLIKEGEPYFKVVCAYLGHAHMGHHGIA